MTDVFIWYSNYGREQGSEVIAFAYFSGKS